MAKTEELDLDTTAQNAEDKKKRLKLILMGVAGVVLLSSAVVGTLYFTGGLSDEQTAESEPATETKAKDDSKALQPGEIKPAFYLKLQPALVTNFEQQAQATYLQIDMEIMARDKRAIDMAAQHMPLIRNNVLMLMSSQKYDDIKTRQGKEKFQQSVLEAIQQVIQQAFAEQAVNNKKADKNKDTAIPNIEAVYFTSLLMQ